MAFVGSILVHNKASQQPELISLTCNGIGKVRRVHADDRDYFVVPVTSIVPGVLNGSRGALHYPPSEIIPSVPLWNRIPVTIGHPSDPITNRPLSARDQGVIERQGVGFLANTQYQGKLTHEAWLEVNALQKKSPEVYQALVDNRPVEVSTGLFTTNMPAPKGASYNSRPYDFVAMRYRPDHLAVLVNEIGACSLNDGCGLLVNASQERGGGGKGDCSGDS